MNLSQIRQAAERLEGMVHHTRIEYSRTFSLLSGGEIYLKPENQQKTGSFKIRGAGNKMKKMLEDGDIRPVVACSAGNHAQGVACAATRLGLNATVVMPAAAPIAKKLT